MNAIIRPWIASLVLVTLAGCMDAFEVGSVDQAAMSANAMSANALSTSALTGNSLTANQIAAPLLLSQPLSATTYDLVAHPNTASEYLATQLVDPYSQELMYYLVTCALEPGQTVTWNHPDPENDNYDGALSLDIEGALGLCPAWATGGIHNDEACQELVSSCLLARNNAYGTPVEVSMRGRGAALTMQPVIEGSPSDDLLSTASCQQGELGPERNCGWTIEHVGTCAAGQAVSLEATGEDCSQDRLVMMRVCAGTRACDTESAQKLAAVNDACTTPVAIECPEEETFTVMLAPAAGNEPPLATGVPLANAQYPASEAQVYDWREGAFFGNVFHGTQSLDVSVDEDLLITYVLTSTTPGSYQLQPGDRDRQHFLAQQALAFSGAVYADMYACYSPEWADGPAYYKDRICAGPIGKEWCAALVAGPCLDMLEPSMCESQDAPPEIGNGDFGACREHGGLLEYSWEYPITTYLDVPCAIVTGTECTTGSPPPM